VIKKGLLKWAWIPALPLAWDALVTLTASWQKIFSHDPKIGYWQQHSQYLAAKAAGKASFGSAKTPEQIDAVIRNTFIQGTLSVVFALLVVIVVLVGVIVALQVIRGGGRPLTEDEPVPSKLFAPRGLIATAAEKEVQRQWDALPS
jgi:carbon starvation protein